MALALGIDGGGTKTVAVLAAIAADGSESIVGRGMSGPSNPQVVGFEKSFLALESAIEAAFAAHAAAPTTVDAACLALAGAGRDADVRRFQAWSKRIAHQTVLAPDAAPVLAAGTPNGWGVALIAGTGSLAYGQDAEGVRARAGGWGPLFGDEGSGYAIALAALQALVRADDGRGPRTELTDRLLDRLQLDAVPALVESVLRRRMDRARLASLAETVVATALAGDAVADAILEEACRDLAEMVDAVARRLRLNSEAFPLALGGGVLVGEPLVRERLDRELRRRGLLPKPTALVDDPALGALRIAIRRLIPTP